MGYLRAAIVLLFLLLLPSAAHAQNQDHATRIAEAITHRLSLVLRERVPRHCFRKFGADQRLRIAR